MTSLKNNNEDLLNLGNLAFIESLREQYLDDPNSVSQEWQDFFKNDDVAQMGPQKRPQGLFRNGAATSSNRGSVGGDVELQEKVSRLVRSYRIRGHLHAKIDPLGVPRPEQKELTPEFYGLTPSDLEKSFSSAIIHTQRTLKIGELIKDLQKSYSNYLGVQFMHIDDIEMKMWIEKAMEADSERAKLTKTEQLMYLEKLTEAVALEEFIQKKFRGAKSFSLEGAESLIPLLTMAIERSVDAGVKEIVIAMAHRGRLNVLTNILTKPSSEIFYEFDDSDPHAMLGGGDVKYHMGHSSEWVTAQGNQCHLSLCFNPSHLEFVNPVALGRCRAKQDRIKNYNRNEVATIVIHGDAAFIGEGVVQETFNLSELEAYKTGGTIHIVCNNQIGFTTGPKQGRSTQYSTDIAKMLQIPIFHVNGEVPDAVAQAVKVATDFRQKFQKDVVIDMYAYRKWGHNETDEPFFTQPKMYEAIRNRKSVRESYLEHLKYLGEVTEAEGEKLWQEKNAHLETELNKVRQKGFKAQGTNSGGGYWKGYTGGNDELTPEVKTGLNEKTLKKVFKDLMVLPKGFTPHKYFTRLFKLRNEMLEGTKPFDWGAAELLAYGSLLNEGTPLRMSGQDIERGTFSHRHAVLHDQKTGEKFNTLNGLVERNKKGWIDISNSPLSEAGVLGFEYGYSLDTPEGLVVWEAQFGDFVNTAQVIIDQFISSAEDKWRRLSGLVMLLPHGFEGMGPEHSSARMERFLNLCAEDNMQVVQPSTPGQIFHLLRRQVHRKWRKPLIVFSPKSLLRHKLAVTPMEVLTNGSYQKVFGNCHLDHTPNIKDKSKVKKILMCSGRVYYDLVEERENRGLTKEVHIVRLEQLYPMPHKDLRQVLKGYGNTPIAWIQDEPENSGPWRYLRVIFGDKLYAEHAFSGVFREASASPATGSKASHKLEQQRLIEQAFSLPE